VSQIPALLLSTAAGMIVTRVASEHADSHLGRDIGGQILAQPRALLIAGVLLALLGLVPGLPMLPFFLLAALTGGVGYRLVRSAQRGTTGQADDGERLTRADTAAALRLPAPVTLRVGAGLTPSVDTGTEDGALLRELIPAMRLHIQRELGVRVPGVKVEGDAQDLPSRGFAVLIDEIPVSTVEVPPGMVLVNAAAPDVIAFCPSVQPASNPANGQPACMVPAAQATMLTAAGFQVWNLPELLVLHLTGVIRRHGDSFLDMQEAQNMLDEMETTHPALVKEVGRVASPLLLSDVLKRLVAEGVSIRDLRTILQTVARWGSVEKNPLQLAEFVRMDLCRQICHELGGGTACLHVHLLDPLVEETIQAAIRQTPAGNYLSLDPAFREDFYTILKRELELSNNGGHRPIILTAAEVRPYVRGLLQADYPGVAVLSYDELAPGVSVQPLASLSVQNVTGD
ncbi:FHIPEP family type III secretion protein, partial [bacterium]|nr:FHIPEP family type III secretion protein [candidate division CSSED10-310 bacterium]